MRNCVGLCFVVSVSMLLGRFLGGVPASAEDGRGHGAGVQGNGDVNGDLEIDLADAVYLLAWLFQGGPELAPCPVKNGNCDAVLLDSGQVTCYDVVGNPVDCTDPGCFGQDGLYDMGCSNDLRFVDHGNGTVTDTCTGLMWQQDTPIDTHTWCEALAYCENLMLAEHDDWRVPNLRELQSIVDYGTWGPSAALEFNAQSVVYWTSSSADMMPSYGWFVDFEHGIVDARDKANPERVRAVRGAP